MHVQCVSFQRSGHHLLMEHLKRHAWLRYGVGVPPERTANQWRVGWFTYCEFYNHCKKTPCIDGALLQKHHDEGARVLPHWVSRPEQKHIIQWRHPVNSIISLFEWKNERIKHYLPWARFAAEQGRMWSKWVLKWVHNNKAEHCFVLSYERLTTQPLECVNEALQLIGIDETATPDDLVETKVRQRDLTQWDIAPIVETTRAVRDLLEIPDEPQTLRETSPD